MVVNEKQYFRNTPLIWAILLIELPTLGLITTLYFTGHLGEEGWIVVLVILAIMSLTFFLLWNLRLELRINGNGVTFRNPPFYNKWTTINKYEMVNFELKKSDGLLEFGGIGIRFSRKTRAFIYSTDYVLIAEVKGKKYAFSTSKHREIEYIISTWHQEHENL
ncbi:MAG: hypothetical protein ACXIUQ_10775 [Cecembia sp.]